MLRPTLKRTYINETLSAIRKGFAGGWRDLKRLRVDPDLDAVRGDPGFKRLLEELERGKKPAAG
jgi:hypothetical protein